MNGVGPTQTSGGPPDPMRIDPRLRNPLDADHHSALILIRIRESIDSDDKRAGELGPSEEELAF